MKLNIANIGKAFKKIKLESLGFAVADLLNKMERPVEINDPLGYLKQAWPDEGGSYVAENEIIQYKYDIQVIMPVYNVEQTLRQAIDSVLSQRGNLKILLVIINDGSPDNSDKIIKEYENHPGVLVINQDNQGLSGARNTGLKNIYAKYITFLDSDDYLAEDALENLFEIAEENQADIVQGSFSQVYPNNKEVDVILHEKNKDGDVVGYPWGKLFRSEIFRNICFPKGYWFEDTIFWWVILPMTSPEKIASSPKVAYYYRVNPEGITATARRNAKVIDTLWICMKIFSIREKQCFPLRANEYESFLRQMLLNTQRIYQYGDKSLTKAAFATIKILKNKYFKEITPPKGSIRKLHDAVEREHLYSFLFFGGLL